MKSPIPRIAAVPLAVIAVVLVAPGAAVAATRAHPATVRLKRHHKTAGRHGNHAIPAHGRAVSAANGKAAIRRFAVAAGDSTGATSTSIAGCIGAGSRTVNCEMHWHYADQGQDCQAQADAYYVGNALTVKQVTSASCSSENIAPGSASGPSDNSGYNLAP